MGLNGYLHTAPGILGTISFLLMVFCVVDLFRNKRPRPVLWLIALLIIPYVSVIYLIILGIVNRKKPSGPQAVQAQPVQQPQTPAEAPVQQSTEVAQPVYSAAAPTAPTEWQNTLPQNPSASEQPSQMYQPQKEPLSPGMQAFRTVGTILGIIAIVAGVAVVGFMILIVIALSSYGSNK
jgi:hypothetical protein